MDLSTLLTIAAVIAFVAYILYRLDLGAKYEEQTEAIFDYEGDKKAGKRKVRGKKLRLWQRGTHKFHNKLDENVKIEFEPRGLIGKKIKGPFPAKPGGKRGIYPLGSKDTIDLRPDIESSRWFSSYWPYKVTVDGFGEIDPGIRVKRH